MIGLLMAAALLLGGAGISKLLGSNSAVPSRARPPASLPLPRWLTHGGGAVLELVIAVSAIAVGGRVGSGLLALSYVVLAAISLRLMAVARGTDCGCFGTPSPINHWHTAVNASYAVVGLTGVLDPPARLLDQFEARPGVTAMVVLGAAALGYLSYLLMTALPELLRVAVPMEVGR